ncbi:MAG: hypothetical protein JSV19_05085 [Phycisphaerales bacterium]|nr:MAG: hypothetical protein JSV19_05085 [Phycisphaerales bacterium]
MTSNRAWNWHRKYTAMVLAGVMAAVLPAALISCGLGDRGSGGGDGGEPPTGDPLGGAILLYANKQIAQGISVPYTTPASATNLRAFRVPASGTGPTAEETGDEVVIAPPPTLLPGEKQTFWFGVEGVPLGPYFVGIRYVLNGREVRVRSDYTITVTGLPVPVFVRPASSRSVYDELLEVRVTVGDSSSTVDWRLFYVQVDEPTEDVPADRLGVAIGQGRGTGISTFWNVVGVAPERYRLGVSITDSGQAIDDTVRAGLEERIITVFNAYVITVLDEAPDSLRPTIEVTEPASDVSVGFGIDTVSVEFEGNIFERDPVDPRIDVFIDTNGAYLGDETVFAGGLSVDETKATLDTSNLAEGTYYVGAVIYDGINAPGVGYAPGMVDVVRSPSLTVTSPDVAMNRRPGSVVDVNWRTNLPDDAGEVDVFLRQMINEDGDLSATEIEVLDPQPLSVTSASFTADETGIFVVFVRIKLDEGGAPLVEEAPAWVKVTTRPTVFWVGDLASPPDSEASDDDVPIPPDAPPAGVFEGALFAGHNFEDNCGSGFMNVEDREETGVRRGEDYNGDGVDDFIILARSAKPEFLNPNGIGVGEAYLVRGRRASQGRFAGSYNVNRVGTTQLPGTVLTGVDTSGSNTLGIMSVTRVSDVDGDELDELIFSFPWTYNSGRRESDLARNGHFTHGGVVIVSSQDPEVSESEETTLSGRVPLDAVGQQFIWESVGPEPGDGLRCGESCWTADLWQEFEDTECPDPETPDLLAARVGCVRGSDDIWDSVIEPTFGFGNTLTGLYYNVLGLCGVPAESPCPTCADLPDEPYGADGYPPIAPEILGAEGWDNAHMDCGDVDFATLTVELYCDQFDRLTGEPQQSAFDNQAGEFAASCMFRYLDASGDDCQEELIMAIARTGRAYAPFPGALRTGYFRDRLAGAESGDDGVVWNKPLAPFGARIIGREPTAAWSLSGAEAGIWPGEGVFGFSVTQSGDFLVMSAPRRGTSWPFEDPPTTLDDLNFAIRGTGYITDLKDLWTLGLVDGSESPDVSLIPPKPHMYLAGGGGHSGRPVNRVGDDCLRSDIFRTDLTYSRGFETLGGGLYISGRIGDHIRHVRGIPDFNTDGRSDIAIGAPEANPYATLASPTISQDGAVYVLYRRAPSLEGNYNLDNLALAPSDPLRLAGVYIKGPEGAEDRFGEVIVGGVDFGGNETATTPGNQAPELVVASPYADSDRGEVWIVFPGTREDPLITPTSGASIDDLLADRKVARIRGSQAGDLFGFNMANAGDIDGDGLNDLLIAAPGATPKFDSTPFDGNDALDANGIDREPPFGVADDIDGPLGIPDGTVNEFDRLAGAGVVYVVLSGADTTDWAADDTKAMEISIDKIGSAELPGFIIAGRRVDDQLGGGRASQDNCHKLSLHDSTGGTADCNCLAGMIPDVCAPRDSWDAGRSLGLAGAGDVDDDGHGDVLIGSILADPRVDPDTGSGTVNGGEAYLIYGFSR